jgi:hypothetical protein
LAGIDIAQHFSATTGPRWPVARHTTRYGPIATTITAKGNKMRKHDNDNKSRTIEPFHRLFAEGLLHKTDAINSQLFYVGQRYVKSYEDAGRRSIQSADYAQPMVSCGRYDSYRDVPIAESRVDRSRLYYDAASALKALGLVELVEAIVIQGRNVVEVGKEYSGRRQDQQARSAAITALGIGLLILREHYRIPARGNVAA